MAHKTNTGRKKMYVRYVSFVNQSQCRNYLDAWMAPKLSSASVKADRTIFLTILHISCALRITGCQSWSKQNWYYQEFGRYLPVGVTWWHHDRDDSVEPFKFEYHVDTLMNSSKALMMAPSSVRTLRVTSSNGEYFEFSQECSQFAMGFCWYSNAQELFFFCTISEFERVERMNAITL